MEKQGDDALYGDAVHSIQEAAAGTCPSCGRGAAGSAAPDLDDLEALISIRDGFNKHRRNFTPIVEDQFRRFDRTISYLHRMIAGSRA
jgi:hypothetical protein